MADKNLVSAPPLQVSISDRQGNMSRPWAIFFRDIYTRIAYKGGNSIDANEASIEELTDAVNANTENITENAESLATHEGLEEAHGSNGDIVGFNDSATELLNGLVKKMALVEDSLSSTVNISTADIVTAPALYDRAYTQSIANLTNENKAAINQLANDLNNAIMVLNNLLSESRLKGQMTNE